MYVGSMSMHLSCGCGPAAYGKMLPQLNEDGGMEMPDDEAIQE